MSKFDALYANGWTQFTRDELLLWYGLTKVTKTIYGDLRQRWERTLEDYMGEQEALAALKKGEEEISVIFKGEVYMLFRNSATTPLSDF